MKANNMSFAEFVTLMALMMALTALAIDSMLPALPLIGQSLGVSNANDNQLIITILFLGFSFGQVIYGPLSDSFGRKPAVYLGFSIAIVGCLISIFATSFTLMLIGRALQGFGLAAARIMTITLIRDQYEGNAMAKVMSLVMMIFILVPIIAPAIGQGILWVADWQMIFVLILSLTLFTLIWFTVRQAETLLPSQRTTFSLSNIIANTMIVLKTPTVLAYTAMTGCVFGSFLGYLSSSQQIFQLHYHLGDMFPLYFATLAFAIGIASFANAKLVMRFGMHTMSQLALRTTAVTSCLFLGFICFTAPALWLFMLYLTVILSCFGILMGNLNALAMSPLGKLAGTGASVVGALSTFISVPFGIIVGQSYNHTVLPLVIGFTISSLLALILMHRTASNSTSYKESSCNMPS